ncbi:proprotein convertase subtilisin/kexin type 4 isoform X6 [Hemicordylus capensis]|uniref:proprotein convertase subtilisin/kexin type 4 isoform X6 n=1 Tax=Hemicordylus capensis TaxID=884348 RepID=UPI002303CEA2|nr:proprotein convertase subtilisin/kexin type 4 isoform X6 [Hemicordylus capensis]
MRRAATAELWLLLLWCCGSSRGRREVYLSSWAVRVPAGAQDAQRLARRHGLLYLGQVIEGEPYYHLEHRGMRQQSLNQHRGWFLRLQKDPHVHWFEQQTLKRRRRRTVRVVPTDPWFHKQWYMNNDVAPDLNVLTAWSQGYTGLGVVVSILDDGIEKDHPDLVANYDPLASYDFNDNDPDPQPRYNAWDENRHGTRCAGEVAAMANNGVCGAGIAYRAKIGGVRMLDGAVTDIVEARSLSLRPQHIDIYSASWGPEDDGKTVDGPGALATEAFLKGIANGRGGLGSLFVWASGNGGLRYDNCNCDGYTNSIYTLSVGSTTENGRVPWYNEPCASTLTATYSSGAKEEKQIVTTDLRHTCTGKHTGTSASAPLAAGMIALALEANPALTWRDMQHLAVRASKPAHLKADDWVTNGVGRRVSHYYGYGLLDAGDLVDLAKKWATAQTQRMCSIKVVYEPLAIGSRLAVSKNVSTCPGKKGRIRSLEHVQVRLSLSYSRRGDLAISLTSPMGTKSTLVALRMHPPLLHLPAPVPLLLPTQVLQPLSALPRPRRSRPYPPRLCPLPRVLLYLPGRGGRQLHHLPAFQRLRPADPQLLPTGCLPPAPWGELGLGAAAAPPPGAGHPALLGARPLWPPLRGLPLRVPRRLVLEAGRTAWGV